MNEEGDMMDEVGMGGEDDKQSFGGGADVGEDENFGLLANDGNPSRLGGPR